MKSSGINRLVVFAAISLFAFAVSACAVDTQDLGDPVAPTGNYESAPPPTPCGNTLAPGCGGACPTGNTCMPLSKGGCGCTTPCGYVSCGNPGAAPGYACPGGCTLMTTTSGCPGMPTVTVRACLRATGGCALGQTCALGVENIDTHSECSVQKFVARCG